MTPTRMPMALLALCLVAMPAVAAARAPQAQPPDGDTAAPAEADPPAQAEAEASAVTARWRDGFIFQSADGDYQLQFTATIQTDGRFANESSNVTDTFLVRKARPGVSARVARYFEFRLQAELAGGSAAAIDAYFDTRFSSTFRLRAGKDKTPVGYELMVADPFVLFPERALPSGLVPNRDIGIQAIGTLWDGRVRYLGGVFNGVIDGVLNAAESDANDGKDVAALVVYQPFAAASSSWENGLGFHFGGSTGMQRGSLPSYRTSVGQVYYAYAAGSMADGRRTRVTPAVFYFHGGVGAFGEYVHTTQAVGRGGAVTDVANNGWDVTGSYVLTGEPSSDRGIRPRRPFDPASHQWGALQVAARYSTVSIDAHAFASGLAAPNASETAEQFSLALNWYPTAFTKWLVSYERIEFDHHAEGARPIEHAVVFRAQLAL